MILLLPVALLLPVWTGRELLARAGIRGRDSFALTLAAFTGFGFVSVMYFLWRSAGGPSDWRYLVFEGTLALALAGWNRFRPEKSPSPQTEPRPPDGFNPKWLAAASILMMAASCWNLWTWYSNAVHGSLDAWAIWNLHARFLYLGGADWAARYGEVHPLSHIDYPMLFPSLQARLWTYAGDGPATRFAGILLQYFSVPALVFSVLDRTGRRWLAWTGLLIVMPPSLTRQAASQIADLPLAGFMALSVALLCLGDRLDVERRRALLLAGFMAGCAAWTKNEGKLFLLVFTLTAVAFEIWRSGARQALRPGINLLSGAALPLLALVTFTIIVPSSNDLVSAAEKSGHLQKVITDGERYATIAGAFVKHIARFGWGAPWVLAVVLWMSGRAKPPAPEGSVVLILMLGGYFAAYLVTPWKLDWHIVTSMDRLLLQVWPSALLLAMTSTQSRTDML